MKIGILLIAIGFLMAISGAVVIACRKQPEEKPLKTLKQPTAQTPSPEIAMPSEVNTQPSPANIQPKTAKAKGNDFEAFIADMLKDNGISIETWNQGTVTQSGTIARNALDPDFFVSQPTDSRPLQYWVEAKWRADVNGSFSIDSEQFERYRSKQRQSKRKIIIALGVGGTPSDPKATYFIPLDSIISGTISREDMKQFYLSKPSRDFANRMNRWFFNEVFKKSR